MSELNIKDILISNGFHYNKNLGQNFITDANLLSAIVTDSRVTKDDIVIEIGTGAGTLTRELAKVAKKVYSFELDKNLISILNLSLKGYNNVEVVFKDILRMKDDEIEEIVGGEFKVVANLPYYVTTPMIMRFLESSLKVKSLTVMVQKEVADRFVASPNTKDYAAVTLAISIRGECKILRDVSRKMFFPEPNVDSAVIRIDIDREKLKGVDLKKLSRLIKASFAMRRKTLTNNLASGYGLKKDDVNLLLKGVGFSEMVRGEVLSLDDYILLLRAMEKREFIK